MLTEYRSVGGRSKRLVYYYFSLLPRTANLHYEGVESQQNFQGGQTKTVEKGGITR
jgi:hypothetical protein